MTNFFWAISFLALSYAPASCAKKKATVSSKVEFQSIAGSHAALANANSSKARLLNENPDDQEFFSGSTTTEQLSLSVDSESLLFPVYKIGVSIAAGTLSNFDVYTCPGSGDDCLVDLADSEAVSELLNGLVFTAESSVGEEDKDKTFATIDGLNIFTAPLDGSSSTNTMKIKAQASISDYTWYTTDSDQVLSSQSANYDYVSIVQSQNFSKVRITPTELKNGDTLKVTLFANIQEAVSVMLADGGVGGCASRDVTVANRSVCAISVEPIAYVGDSEPTVESYLLSVDGRKARFNVLLDSDDIPLSGYLRPYYDGSNKAFTEVGGGIESVVPESGSTYKVNGYGSSTDGEAAGTYEMFSKFKRANHSGTITVLGSDFSYEATKL